MHRRLTVLVTAGVALLGAAALLQLTRGGSSWSTPLLAGGGLVWTVAVVLSWRDITQHLSKRSTRYGLNAMLLSFLVAVSLFLIGTLSDHYSWRRDLSSTGKFTLSEKTLNVLEGIRKDIDIYVYYERSARDAVRDLLTEYARRNRRLHVRLEDLNASPELAERFGVTELGTLVFDAKDKFVRVRTAGEEMEEDITNALIKASRPGQKKVYFLDGHGEKNIGDKGRNGYSTAAAVLQRENYATAMLRLAEVRDVPEDCDVLVVAGPKSGLLDQEIEAIQRFMQRGGRAFCFLDPLFRTQLEDWVGRWGIEVGNDRVVDPSPMGQLLGRGPYAPMGRTYGAHPVTKQFKQLTYFPDVRSVRRLQLYGGGAETASLVSTSPESYAESNLQSSEISFDANDLAGPVSIAMASRLKVEGLHPDLEPAVSPIPGQEVRSGEALKGAGGQRGNEARLVVFGDSNFASNQCFNDMGNGNLFLNAMAWLAEDEDLIAVRPQQGRVRSVTMTLATVRLLNVVVIVVAPIAVFTAGLVATLRRRARG